jgi:hypothetical protein
LQEIKPYAKVFLSAGNQPTKNMKNKVTRKTLRAMSDKSGFICKPGQTTPKLRITEDGTIYRADTDLTLCRSMSVSEAAKTLGI